MDPWLLYWCYGSKAVAMDASCVCPLEAVELYRGQRLIELLYSVN